MRKSSAHIAPQGKSLQCLAVLFLLAAFLPAISFAQTEGDFRSRGGGGQWSKRNSWDEYTVTGWQNTKNVPDSGSGLVTILTGHTVTANSNGSYDQVVVQAGAVLKVTKAFTIVNGPGTDLEVFGTLDVSKAVALVGNATAVFRSGSTLNILNNDTFSLSGTSLATFESGSAVNNSGTLDLLGSSQVVFQPGTSFLNSSDVNLADSAQLLIDGATLTNQGTVSSIGTSVINFANGAIYVHDQNGGALPTATNTIWGVDSEVIISGTTNSLPTELNANFYNFTWDSAGQIFDLDMAGAPLSIQGDFTVASTGSANLIWDATGSDMNVAGDFIQTGGGFVFTDSGSATMSISGDFIQSGGTTNLATTSGSPTLEVAGDLIVGSTLTSTSPTPATISLNGSLDQTIQVTGTLTGAMDLSLSGAGLKTLASNLTLPGSLSETSGGIDLAGFDLSLSGDLTISSQLLNPGSITFTGTGDKLLQLPPSTASIPELIFDVAGANLILQSDITITSVVNLLNGSMDLNGFDLVLAEGALFFSTGPVTGNMTMSRTYSWNDDGWRMIAAPLGGINYSSLNSAFWTQGAPWALNTSGTSNLQSFNFATQDWSPVSGADAELGVGGAYILYAYKNNGAGVSVLPTTWTVTGTIQSVPSASLQYSGDPATSYNFIGNPLTTNLDWNASYFASSGVSSSYATWDPSATTGGGTTGYKYYDAASGVGQAGRYIPPFTGFMVSATAAAASLSFETSEAASLMSANYFGKGNDTAPHIQLLIEGQGLAEDEMYLSFGAEATDASNMFDVERLSPLSMDFATAWMNSGDRKLAFDGRDMQTGREIYDVVFATTRSGIYEISAPKTFEIPTDWSISLIDLESGQSHSLRNGEVYRFQTRSKDVVTLKNRLEQVTKPRFRIVVENPDVASDNLTNDVSTAADVTLSQNYPNPFNPTTSIRFSIPEASPVRLDVYDALGRRVQTLMNESVNAGWHEVSWNAQDLSSGMYFYRLSFGAQVLTRSMMLLR